jgi:hypothetical protein
MAHSVKNKQLPDNNKSLLFRVKLRYKTMSIKTYFIIVHEINKRAQETGYRVGRNVINILFDGVTSVITKTGIS